MASPFKSLLVYINNKGHRVLAWQFVAGAAIPQKSTLTVQYARSGGPWQILAEDLPLAYCYTDTRATNKNKYNNDFYRVTLKTPAGIQYTSQIQQSGINLVYPYSSKAANLLRLSELEAQETGRQGFLLKKIVYGQKCPVCRQFEDDHPVNQHCPHCLGTGKKGGYYKAISLNILESSQQQSVAVGPQGQLQTKILQAKCSAWPLIRPGDVWVDKFTNQRYYIDQAAIASKLKHVPLVYMLTMHYLQQTDILHSQVADNLLQEAYVGYQPSQWDKVFE